MVTRIRHMAYRRADFWSMRALDGNYPTHDQGKGANQRGHLVTESAFYTHIDITTR